MVESVDSVVEVEWFEGIDGLCLPLAWNTVDACKYRGERMNLERE